MNDDREPHLRLVDLMPPPMAQVIGFHPTGRMKPLFAGWVGCDGNVVPLKAPTRKVTFDQPRDDEWI